jgi:hypothetical protein
MIKSPEHGMNPEMIFRNARREERRAPHHVVRARAIFEEKRGKARNMCSGFVEFSKKRSKAKQSPEHGLGGFYFWRMHKNMNV